MLTAHRMKSIFHSLSLCISLRSPRILCAGPAVPVTGGDWSSDRCVACRSSVEWFVIGCCNCEGPALGRRWVLFFTQPPFSLRSAFACKLESNELWLSLYIISALSLCPVRLNEYEWCNNVWLKPRGTRCQDNMSSSHSSDLLMNKKRECVITQGWSLSEI